MTTQSPAADGTNPTQALRALVIDDEPLAVERLTLLLGAEAAIACVGTACDGEAGLALCRELAPDLLFLDIAMPGMDGLSVARALRSGGQRPGIVFVTAFDNFAVDAFDLDIIDYVLKPVSADRLHRAVERALERSRHAGDGGAARVSEFWVPHRSELVRVAAADIDRIEAERDYMRLHLGARSYLLHQTIAALEERLDPARFIRIHRSHIVRRDYVTGLRHDGGGVWFAKLADGGELRIGRKYLGSVKAFAGR